MKFIIAISKWNLALFAPKERKTVKRHQLLVRYHESQGSRKEKCYIVSVGLLDYCDVTGPKYEVYDLQGSDVKCMLKRNKLHARSESYDLSQHDDVTPIWSIKLSLDSGAILAMGCGGSKATRWQPPGTKTIFLQKIS